MGRRNCTVLSRVYRLEKFKCFYEAFTWSLTMELYRHGTTLTSLWNSSKTFVIVQLYLMWKKRWFIFTKSDFHFTCLSSISTGILLSTKKNLSFLSHTRHTFGSTDFWSVPSTDTFQNHVSSLLSQWLVYSNNNVSDSSKIVFIYYHTFTAMVIVNLQKLSIFELHTV